MDEMFNMDWLMGKLNDKKQAIRDEVCNLCGEPVLSFKNEISKHEYSISGCCQNCQDELFEKDPFVEDEDE